MMESLQHLFTMGYLLSQLITVVIIALLAMYGAYALVRDHICRKCKGRD